MVLALASSGSTGAPKLARVSAAQLRARIDLQARCHGVSAGARVLLLFPLHHTGGLHTLLACASLGASLVLAPGAHPRSLVRTCAEEGVTVLPGPPTVFDLLARHGREDGPSLSGVRFARSTAAALSLETWRAFTDAFGLPLWQSYGASETGAISSNRHGTTHRGRLALGAPPEGVEVAVRGPDGAELADGEVGELVVRSPAVALGYEGGSAAGGGFREGAFFTGDLGYRHAGHLYFCGRSKLLINVGGHKVDPFEVEAVLRRHPSVADAAVVAQPAGSREVVKALVVAREPVTAEALTDFCSRGLAPHQVPRRVEFRTALPRSALGKLLRERL